MNLRSTALAESISVALARRSSLVRRSCSKPQRRSTRPLAWGLLAAEHLFQQAEIAERGLRREELGGQDFAGGVVLHAESGELRAATFEPVVRAAVELHEFAEASGTQAALAMSGGAALP